MGDYSTFLFAKPSMAEGVARIFDFAGALNQYNTTPNGAAADRRALDADWLAVASDINDCICRKADMMEM